MRDRPNAITGLTRRIDPAEIARGRGELSQLFLRVALPGRPPFEMRNRKWGIIARSLCDGNLHRAEGRRIKRRRVYVYKWPARRIPRGNRMKKSRLRGIFLRGGR